MGIIPMRKMEDNQKGKIAYVKATGELGKRIREMGIVKGAEIKIQGRAPLYDPVSIKVGGCVISLRNSEADYIGVEEDI